MGAAPEIIDHGRTGFLCDTTDEMVSCLQYVETIDRKECRLEAEEPVQRRREVSGLPGEGVGC